MYSTKQEATKAIRDVYPDALIDEDALPFDTKAVEKTFLFWPTKAAAAEGDEPGGTVTVVDDKLVAMAEKWAENVEIIVTRKPRPGFDFSSPTFRHEYTNYEALLDHKYGKIGRRSILHVRIGEIAERMAEESEVQED